jgi:hypothetical protein
MTGGSKEPEEAGYSLSPEDCTATRGSVMAFSAMIAFGCLDFLVLFH